MRDRALPVHGERGRAPAIGASERSAFGGADPKKGGLSTVNTASAVGKGVRQVARAGGEQAPAHWG